MSFIILPLVLALHHSLFLRILPIFSHFYNHLFCEKHTDNFTGCWLRTYYPPGPISPVAAQSPVSLGSFSAPCPPPADSPIWVQSSGRRWRGGWSGGGMRGRRDRGRVVLHWGTAASLALCKPGTVTVWRYKRIDSVEQDWQHRVGTRVHGTVKSDNEKTTQNKYFQGFWPDKAEFCSFSTEQ